MSDVPTLMTCIVGITIASVLSGSACSQTCILCKLRDKRVVFASTGTVPPNGCVKQPVRLLFAKKHLPVKPSFSLTLVNIQLPFGLQHCQSPGWGSCTSIFRAWFNSIG